MLGAARWFLTARTVLPVAHQILSSAPDVWFEVDRTDHALVAPDNTLESRDNVIGQRFR